MDEIKLLEHGSRVFMYQGQHFTLLSLDMDCWHVARAEDRGGCWYQIGQAITPFAIKVVESIERQGQIFVIE